jgi:hypothetical protein
MRSRLLGITLALAAVSVPARPALAQAPLPADVAPSYAPAELDRIVSPIALYPDPLLAQVLAAATYPSDIPDAARWADAHRSSSGDRLAAAMTAEDLPWNPSVQALLPFPSVLDMMAGDLAWTEEVGDAVLAQRADVMDAVQRMRDTAWERGYLNSNGQVTVTYGPWIEIVPVNGFVVPVPVYDPRVVFGPAGRGIVLGSGISYRFAVGLGPAFAPWGWGATRVVWPRHAVIINNVPWRRTWTNRTVYVHPYAVPRVIVRPAVSASRDPGLATVRTAPPSPPAAAAPQRPSAVQAPERRPSREAQARERAAREKERNSTREHAD